MSPPADLLQRIDLIDRLVIGQRSLLDKELKELAAAQTRAKTLGERQIAIDEALAFFQKVAADTQDSFKFHLEDIVNTALEAIFPGDYKFAIIFEPKRNKTEARLAVFKNGRERDPFISNGGGLCDIISFGLRMALLMISHNRRVLVLDEPFKNLDALRQPLAYAIVKQLSLRLKVQIIMVTHQQDAIDVADRVFTVRLKKGASHVTSN